MTIKPSRKQPTSIKYGSVHTISGRTCRRHFWQHAYCRRSGGDLVRDGKDGCSTSDTPVSVLPHLTPRERFHRTEPSARCSRSQGTGRRKVLALNTPLLTPNDWTTMGDRRRKIKSMGWTVNQCNVVAMTEIMFNRHAYTIEFRNGKSLPQMRNMNHYRNPSAK